MMRLLTLFIALLLAAGCGTPKPAEPAAQAPEPAPAEVSFAKDIQPVFTASCMPCHSGGADAKSLYVLTSHAGVMGTGKDSVANVLPGEPDSSRLGWMLTMGRMPPSGPLDPAKVTLVRDWIDKGAKNN